MTEGRDGPSLQDYVETRLNLLTEQIKNMGNRFDEQLREADVHYEQRFRAQIEATSKADTASERRFESVNEFRKTLTDQTLTFVTRNEYGGAHASLSDRLGKIENSLTAIESRTAGSQSSRTDSRSDVALWISGIMMLISLIALGITFLRK